MANDIDVPRERHASTLGQVVPISDQALAFAEPDEAERSDGGPGAGIALCLSGGGYRAMLFHVGVLWRLNQLAQLPRLNRVSSVSGGSITAGQLGLAWKSLHFDSDGVARNFEKEIVDPLRELARHTIDVGSVISGILTPFHSVADSIEKAYRKRLFGDATLQNLPDPPAPRFVLNATSVQTGALWRFSKPYMGDYQVGLTRNPPTSLAAAVAASSAFPPFLSPVALDTSGMTFEHGNSPEFGKEPFTTRVVLSDGGVYDNLRLETAFKRFDTLLVSDAGAKIAGEGEPHSDWGRHAVRVLDIVDNQVRSLRKRALIAAFRDTSGNPLTSRRGAYWGIRTDIADYKLDTALNVECPHQKTLELAAVPTRLAETSEEVQERLINWGYAVCDAAVRKHYLPSSSSPKFPYARGI